jgi:hypothetical protein
MSQGRLIDRGGWVFMGWASRAIAALQVGRSVTIRPHGGSMRPKVESGATVTVEPVALTELSVGDIVLCRVGGNVYLHLVKAIEGSGDQRRVQIGNNRGKVNGWTRTIYGRASAIDSWVRS